MSVSRSCATSGSPPPMPRRGRRSPARPRRRPSRTCPTSRLAVRHPDRLPREPQRADRRAGGLSVERREEIVGCEGALNRSSRLGPTSHSAIASSEREQDNECPEDGRTGAKELGGRRIGEYTHLVGFLLGGHRAARR